MADSTRRIALVAALVAALIAVPATAHAYVGPGAGVAVATTLFALLVTVVVVLVGMLVWPIRWVIRRVTRKRPEKTPRIRRAIIVGLDGLDPRLVRRWMDEGRLPNLKKLSERGTLSDLQTTYPAMSPVAWSSFATGVNPAKHGIFDFLTRDRRTYMADLSSAEVRPPRRSLTVGNLQIPIGKPELRLLRKSKPFWEILGRYQVPCSVLRVPITFPPEPFDGTLLSAMCVPDLQGSQGSFTYFSSAADAADEAIGGNRIPVEIVDGKVEAYLDGPPNPLRKDGAAMRMKLELTLHGDGKGADLKVGKTRATLALNEYTDWTEVAFPMALGLKMRGICRFRLLEAGDVFRLYVSPINIDPSRPILPISHPRIFSVFLSKLIGRYATLGLAEDTWALNEGVIDEDAFLEQAWDNHEEREAMFFEMLKRTPKGLITCVFDGTDRIQHMFMRYLDDGHPALKGDDRSAKYRDVIENTYARMDTMIGRVLEHADASDPNTLVVVMSDHGFQTFRRGVNLNSWLMEHGYLVLEEGRTETGEWFQGVDWSRTKAFALGLGGIFLNVKGREAQGMVEPGEEAEALATEIAQKLSGLRDPDADAVAISEAYASHALYRGPYRDDAPDIIVGYSAGWRASWDGVRGIVDNTVFDDNTKAWSGDHCIDPKLVPGVLIANRRLASDEGEAAISDIAPTVLDLFGVDAPRYMDGTSLARA